VELDDETLARPFAAVRESCAEVAARARAVSIDAATLERYAAAVPLAELGSSPTGFPAVGGDVETLCAFVLALDAINFGSGWFPHLKKRADLSGYRTIEAHLRERFERHGAPSARELRALDARAVADWLGQAPAGPPPCTTTSLPSLTSFFADSGTSAKRRSPCAISRGTPIFMARTLRGAAPPRKPDGDVH
jgi:hypothetical protein